MGESGLDPPRGEVCAPFAHLLDRAELGVADLTRLHDDRIGDLGLLLGMLWWYDQAGTLLFFDHGNGALEPAALTSLATLVSRCEALPVFQETRLPFTPPAA